ALHWPIFDSAIPSLGETPSERQTDHMMRRNRKSKPLRERLLARIDKTPGFGPHGECWRWNGAHTKGRPVIGVTVNGKKKKLFVARVIYEETIGPIPRGKELDHTCRFK